MPDGPQSSVSDPKAQGFVERRWHWWLSRVGIPLLVAVVAASVAITVAWMTRGSSSTVTSPAPDASADCSSDKTMFVHGWGPDRPTVGSSDYTPQPSFNVERDNPNYGDERGFLILKEASYQKAGGWSQSLDVLPGQVYLARIYLHNGARDADEYAAVDTHVGLVLPNCSGRSLVVRASISSTNAFPGTVWATSVIRSDVPVRVELVPGSVEVETNSTSGPVQLPDRLFAPGGVRLGNPNVTSGVFRGDYANTAVVTAQFRTAAV